MINTIKICNKSSSFSYDLLDGNYETDQEEIEKLLVSFYSTKEKSISAPKIGISKKIMIIDRCLDKKSFVHDPIILLNPRVCFNESCNETINEKKNKKDFKVVYTDRFGKQMELLEKEHCSVVKSEIEQWENK